MHKFLIIIILAAVALAACAPLPAVPSGQSEPMVEPARPTEISTVPAAEAAVQASGPAECRVVAKMEPNPTIEAILPRVAEKDWTKGPDGAAVAITEYSDFQ